MPLNSIAQTNATDEAPPPPPRLRRRAGRPGLERARFRTANPDYQLGKPFVYVGMTGLDPDLRFDKHKAGIQANRFVLQVRPAPAAGAVRGLQPDALRGRARDGGGAGHRPARSGLRRLAGLSLHTALDACTVIAFSRPPPCTQPHRQFYCPKPDRVPAWLRKIWLWF